MEDLIQRLAENGVAELGAEFVEIRLERTRGLGIYVVDGVTREVAGSLNVGIGARAFKDGAWGFAAGTVTRRALIEDTVKSAVKIAKRAGESSKEKFKLSEAPSAQGTSDVPIKVDPEDITVPDKVRFVIGLSKQASAFSPKVVNVNSFFGETTGHTTIVNSFGTNIRKQISRVRAGASAYVAEDGVRERGYEVVGGTGGYEIVQTEVAQTLGQVAADRAVKLLQAKPAPSGKFTIVMDPKLVGVFIHEAFGHACEADKVLAGASILEGRIGSTLGNESITVVDDPTIEGLYGSFSHDDEGVPSHPRRLLEKGVLKRYLHSIETASRMGVESNGAARAQDFMTTPIVRMSNTFVSSGEVSTGEIFEGVKDGIYAVGSEYGYVIPANGQFTFKCEYAHLIENGEPGKLLRDAALSGLILESLHNVEAIGRDVRFEPGVCGKSGQTLPITTGGPHIRVANMVVGGMR